MSSGRPVARRQPRQHLDQSVQVLAQQRLAAGQADLLDAVGDERARQPRDLLEAQQFGVRQEAVVPVEDLLRHAVGAAEVAAIRDRDAQVAQRPRPADRRHGRRFASLAVAGGTGSRAVRRSSSWMMRSVMRRHVSGAGSRQAQARHGPQVPCRTLNRVTRAAYNCGPASRVSTCISGPVVERRQHRPLARYARGCEARVAMRALCLLQLGRLSLHQRQAGNFQHRL